MNILAIDYGTKNIGLARVSTNMAVVLPFGRIKNQEIKKLIELINKEKIDKVVTGLPFGLDGKENKNTARVKKFIVEIKKHTSIPVDFETEIFSSQAADRMGQGVTRDEKSALIILQSYLDKIKK
jgi:putative holliday junction resolvase